MKQQAAHVATEEGIKQALLRGERLRFFTLTQDPARPMDVSQLGENWNRLRTTLKDAALLKEYTAVVETTKAGAPHLHVIATGKYIKKQLLSEMASDAGFGKVVDISALGGKELPPVGPKRDLVIDRLAGYVSKYLSKPDQRQALDTLAGERVRPIRFSYGWGASLKWGREELIRRWRQDRGEESPERHPDDEWVLVVRVGRGTPLKVYRGREQIDAEDLQAIAWGFMTATDELRLLLGSSCARGADPPRSLPPPLRPRAAATRLFEPGRQRLAA